MANKSRLKGVKNSRDRPIYINTQEPDAYTAMRKEVSHGIKKIKEINKSKQGQKISFQVKKRLLFVDDKPMSKAITVPKVMDLFVDEEEQLKMDKIKFISTDPVSEEGSVFTAFACKASNMSEITRAYRRLKQIHPSATHISMAFDCLKKQGNHDDGEYGAGLVIQKRIEEQKMMNRAVFVIRNYGGKRLGPKRFDIIDKLALQALVKIK